MITKILKIIQSARFPPEILSIMSCSPSATTLSCDILLNIFGNLRIVFEHCPCRCSFRSGLVRCHKIFLWGSLIPLPGYRRRGCCQSICKQKRACLSNAETAECDYLLRTFLSADCYLNNDMRGEKDCVCHILGK